MGKINRFVINKKTASLTLIFDNVIHQDTAHLDSNKDGNKTMGLSFEYLRVYAPTDDKDQPTGSTPKVYHKKQVKLLNIESVGKHGYRLIFDDNHSNIYDADYLHLLCDEYQQRWQHYLQSASTAINNREATIEIKEVK